MTTDILKNILLSACMAAMAGCATTPNGINPYDSKLEQVNTSINNLEKSLTRQIVENCKQDNDTLVTQLAAAISTSEPVKPEKAPVEVEYIEGCQADEGVSGENGKLVMGEVEKIFFVKEKVAIEARIDTGAETSSLGVYKLARFERDGEKWIRFSLSDTEDAAVHRYVIYDSVRIKQESDEKAERRREIRMDLKIGDKKYRNQVFNLADRSHLEYQVLIGRNFLRDIAVVDVSGSHLLEGE